MQTLGWRIDCGNRINGTPKAIQRAHGQLEESSNAALGFDKRRETTNFDDTNNELLLMYLYR